MSDKKETEKRFRFGPLEQAIAMVVVMGFASHPSLPLAFQALNPRQVFSPAIMMLVIIVYIGYHLLKRQEAARAKIKEKAKAARSSSSRSSSSSKPLSSSDVRAGKMGSSSARSGNPAPKQVSSSGRNDPSATTYSGNYFLTMQGPGRPALVPFQSGLRPKKGEAAGTMWWDNVPEDAAQLMAPPVDPRKARAMTKNPFLAQVLHKDLQLLLLEKQKQEEEARFEKAGAMLQSLLGLLLCAVDMRLGIATVVFFLWRYFVNAQEREKVDEKAALAKEKADLTKQISEARAGGGDRQLLKDLSTALESL